MIRPNSYISTYTYKSGQLSSVRRLQVDEAGFSLYKADRLVRRVEFKNISKVRVSEMRQQGISFVALIILEEGRKTVLNSAQTVRSYPEFLMAISEVLEAIGRSQPHLQVFMGASPIYRFAFSCLGLFQSLAGGAMLAAAVSGPFQMGEQFYLGAAGAAIALTGLATALSFNPFRHPEEIFARKLAGILARSARDQMSWGAQVSTSLVGSHG